MPEYHPGHLASGCLTEASAVVGSASTPKWWAEGIPVEARVEEEAWI